MEKLTELIIQKNKIKEKQYSLICRMKKTMSMVDYFEMQSEFFELDHRLNYIERKLFIRRKLGDV